MESKLVFCGSKMKPEIEQSMIVTKEVKKMRDSLFWGFFNAVCLAILFYDILYTWFPLCSPTFHLIEQAIAVILLINTVFHFCRYFWMSFTLQPVSLSPRQKSLLGIRESDYYFKAVTSTPVKPAPPTFDSPMCVTPLNMSTNSWLSSSIISQCGPSDSIKSGNINTSLPSWLYQSRTSPSSTYQSSILATSDVIQDESMLQQYLKEFESFEKSSVVESSMEQPSNMLSGFWSHPASRTGTDVSPLLRRCTYQMSLSPAQTQSGVGPGDETGSPSPYQYADVWRKNKINPSALTEWTANLRMWISQTILERLVSEISVVDSTLHAQGLVDITVGVVGLERLKKTAQIPQVVMNVPTLPKLVPFLEVSQNQEYIVARIKELAKGGCMSEYRWNSGGVWEGKEWAPPLPTDAALVLHLVASYLDSQLPQTLPDSRPFSSQHLVRLPDKPQPGQLCIVETSTSPPNYILQTRTDTYHSPKGRNNLFFTILLFLHTVKTKDHGILGRINLGPSGVNMLWTINSDS